MALIDFNNFESLQFRSFVIDCLTIALLNKLDFDAKKQSVWFARDGAQSEPTFNNIFNVISSNASSILLFHVRLLDTILFKIDMFSDCVSIVYIQYMYMYL